MFADIFGMVNNLVKGLVANNSSGEAQRKDTLINIGSIISGGKFGAPVNIAKQARRNIGQFPMILSNAIGDDQALKICEIVERTIADMILLCIQNGNNLLNLNDPEEKRKFIDSYTNAGNSSLDLDIQNYGDKFFASDYKNNVSGIDALTLKRVANEAMYLEDMPITSSFEMTTLFNPCLSLEEEFDMGAVAPVSVPMGQATAGNNDDEYEDATEAVKPQPGPNVGGNGGGNRGNGGGNGGNQGNGGRNQRSRVVINNITNNRNNTPDANQQKNNAYFPKKAIMNPKHGGRIRGYKHMGILDGTKAAKIEEKISKLSPTIVNATVLLQTPTDTLERNLAFGVKVNAHEVSSEELISAIKETYSSSSLVARLIRWRSGELSFFKDVLLNLKEIKQTVASRNNRNTKNGLSGVFASMRFMNKTSIAATALSANGAILPTVSIMITLDEVDIIKNSCGKDLFKNIKDARELCSKLGLFGIHIVDTANDSFYSYFNDGASMYKKTSLKDNKNKNSDDVVKAIFGALKR